MEYAQFSQQINVSRETYDRLALYIALLRKWQAHINLVSPHTLADLWVRHIVDCAQLIYHIPRKDAVILDIGSGAGLPGLVLSILGYEHIHLAESDQRKGAFLQEAMRQLGLNCTLHSQRVEDMTPFPCDAVTARACASLSDVLSWAYPFCHPQTVCLFPKGEKYASECKDASLLWQMDVTMHPSLTHSHSRIIQITDLRRREDG